MEQLLNHLEARVGIEPTYKGFADLSLTTWVPRHQITKLAFCAENVQPLDSRRTEDLSGSSRVGQGRFNLVLTQKRRPVLIAKLESSPKIERQANPTCVYRRNFFLTCSLNPVFPRA